MVWACSLCARYLQEPSEACTVIIILILQGKKLRLREVKGSVAQCRASGPGQDWSSGAQASPSALEEIFVLEAGPELGEA